MYQKSHHVQIQSIYRFQFHLTPFHQDFKKEYFDEGYSRRVSLKEHESELEQNIACIKNDGSLKATL
jgi:hypothetical protein